MNKVFLLVALLLVASCSFAQTRFGAVVGLNLASFNGNDATMRYADPFGSGGVRTMQGPNMRTGLAIGATMDVKASENISFCPEVTYSMKGGTYSDNIDVQGTMVKLDLTLKYDYLDIPLLFKYTIPTQGNVRPMLFAGPSLGVLISANAKAAGSSGTQTTESESSIQNQSSIEAGLVAGAGLAMQTGAVTLQFGARYGFGLTPVDNTPGASVDVKNSYIGIMTGILF